MHVAPSPGVARVGGFSLVEMMVALVAGLIVIGSVLAFAVSMARSSGATIKATRLDQELRTTTSLITRELRRAGYYRKNYNTIASNSFTQSYAGICLASGLATCATASSTATTTTSTEGCLVLSYDRFNVNDGAQTPGATEYKAFRRRVVGGVGRLEVNLVDSPPSCSNTASANWLTLSNPSIVDITSLVFTYAPTQVQAGVNPTNSANINVTVRNVTVAVTGNVVGDANVSRTFSELVRVRSDLVSNP